jgi:hypothetical protein
MEWIHLWCPGWMPGQMMESRGLGTGGSQGTRRPALRGPAKPPRCPAPRAGEPGSRSLQGASAGGGTAALAVQGGGAGRGRGADGGDREDLSRGTGEDRHSSIFYGHQTRAKGHFIIVFWAQTSQIDVFREEI